MILNMCVLCVSTDMTGAYILSSSMFFFFKIFLCFGAGAFFTGLCAMALRNALSEMRHIKMPSYAAIGIIESEHLQQTTIEMERNHDTEINN